jgi:hypothetical protein
VSARPSPQYLRNRALNPADAAGKLQRPIVDAVEGQVEGELITCLSPKGESRHFPYPRSVLGAVLFLTPDGREWPTAASIPPESLNRFGARAV